MIIKPFFFVALLFLLMIESLAQNVGIGTNNPNAALEVNSSNNGFLPPRLNFTQRVNIQNPAQGLMIYCTDCGTNGQLQVFNGVSWIGIPDVAATDGVFIDLNSPITIGNRVWSSKNLSVSNYRNGDPIPKVSDPAQWANLTSGAWCWYNNDSASYAGRYGKLYNWYAINDSRGLAPIGWHISNENDWNNLLKSIDPNADTLCQNCTQSEVAGGYLKKTIEWNSPNSGATDIVEFAAVPGGLRQAFSGSFFDAGNYARYWSAISENSSTAINRGLGYNGTSVYKNNAEKSSGFSVRIVKDLPVQQSLVIPPGTPPAFSDGDLYIIGSATPGGWSNPVPTNQKFTKLSPYLYEIVINLNGGGSYLFLPVNGSWTAKYGAAGPNNTNAVMGDNFIQEGGDFIAPANAGTYKISVNFFTGKFKLTQQ